MKILKISTLVLFLALASSVESDEPVGAMGCEFIQNSTKKYNNKENYFITLYKSYGSYSKICRDNIGEASLEPMTCYDVKVDANVIRSGGYAPYDIQIRRQDLRTAFLRYSDPWNSGIHLYSCKKSADPKSVENFIKNAKSEQLKSNQF